MNESPKPIRRRRVVYGLALLALAIFAIYYAFWLEGAKSMRGAVAHWIADQRAAGLTVNHHDIRSEGFPFKLRAIVDELEISGPAGADQHGAGGADQHSEESWRWRAPRVHIDILPRATDRLTFSAAGPQEVFVSGAGAWRIDSDAHRFVLASDDARLWTARLESGPAKLTALDGRHSAAAQKTSLSAAPVAANHDNLEIAAAFADAEIELNGALLEIAAFEVDLEITQTPLLDGGERWKDAGGALRLTRVYVETEGLQATLSGVITLDANGYPQGRLDAQIIKPAGIGRLLAKAGVLRADEAAATQTALALMAVASGGKISAPIILKDGKATLGGVTLADLPRVD